MEISIIIPIYNVEKYLEACLDSIFKQNNSHTLKNIEVIGINDLTQDNSAKIFESYIEDHKEYNIRMITHSKNLGIGGARKTGITEAKGNYLLFIDFDYCLNEGSMDFLVSKVKELNQDTLLAFGFEAIKNGNNLSKFIPKKNEVLTNNDALNLISEGLTTPSACNILYPIQLLNKIKFKENIYFQGLEFSAQAINLSRHLEINPKVLFNYRFDGDSITNQKTKSEQINDLYFVLSELKNDLDNNTAFLTILCYRWLHLLRIHELSNDLKKLVLEKIILSLENLSIPLDHLKAKQLSELITKEFKSHKYDLIFTNLKKDLLDKFSGNNPSEKNIMNRVFDHIYVVNLKNANEDRFKISKQLLDHDIDFELWQATNGYLEVNKELYEKYVERGVGNLSHFKEHSEIETFRGRKLIESPGAYGYIQTYISILKNAKENQYKSILILEDDIILVDKFEDKFTSFYNSLKPNWKIIQLGASQYGWGNIEEEDSLNNGYYSPIEINTCGSFSIGINESIYDELLEVQSYFDAPFDHIPMGSLYKKYKNYCYVSFPNICIPDVSSSTIRNSRNQLEHGEKMKWNMNKHQFPVKRFSISILITSPLNLKYIDLSKNSINIFDIRWFVNTVSGLRPIHQNKYLTDERIVLKESFDNTSGIELNTDFEFLLSNQVSLTEELLCKKISSLLGLKHNLSSENNKPDSDINDIIDIKKVKKDSSDNLVSVIIPTYKRNQNLENAINSIINQTYNSIEIIVIDDNGVNTPMAAETRKTIGKFQETYPIRYLAHTTNMNGAAARNTGILHSNGKYICFLDDDDIYYPEKIEKSVMELVKSTTEIDAVYCGFKGWNSPENDVKRYKTGDLTYELLSLNFKSHYLHTNTALYKKSAIERINGFDECFYRHQDLEFNIRFFEYYEIGTVKEILVELNPVESPSDNKVYNEKMFKLKEQFLSRFNYIIKKFPEEKQKIIYQKNWHEALRFFKSKEHFIAYCDSRIELGHTQVVKHILTESKDKIEKIETSNTIQNNKQLKKDIELERQQNKISINHLKLQLNYHKTSIEKLEREKAWYALTYDHLPLWFLKIGAIFRRIKVKKGF